MSNYRSSSSSRSLRNRSRSNDYNLRSQCDGVSCDYALSLSPTNSYSSIQSSRGSRRSSTPLHTPRRRSAPTRTARSRSMPLRTPRRRSAPLRAPRSRSMPLRTSRRRSAPLRTARSRSGSIRTPRSRDSSSSRFISSRSDSRSGSSSSSGRSRSTSSSRSSDFHYDTGRSEISLSSSASSASESDRPSRSRIRDRKPKTYQNSSVSLLRTPDGSIPRTPSRDLSNSPGGILRNDSTLSLVRSPFLTTRSQIYSPFHPRSRTASPLTAVPRNRSTSPGSLLSQQMPLIPDVWNRHGQNVDRSWNFFGTKSAQELEKKHDDYQLIVDKELKVKTTCAFYFEEDRLVIDSQMIVMPKDFTEMELLQEVDEMKAMDGKVFIEAFTDGEDVMELMELSVLTSRRAIFIRRESKLTLAGKTSAYHYHPIHGVCHARLANQDTALHVESIYSSTRTTNAVSRKEAIVLTFDSQSGAAAHSLELQRQMKQTPLVLPPSEHDGVYMIDNANCAGRVMILERDMHLKKTLWRNAPDWRKEVVGNHLLQTEPTPVHAVARPPATTPPPNQQQERNLQMTPPPPMKSRPRVSDTVSVSPPPATMDDARQQTFRSARTPPTVNGRSSVVKKLSGQGATPTKSDGKSAPVKKKHDETPMPKQQHHQLKKAMEPNEYVVLVPKVRLTINGPFNLAGVYSVVVKNVGPKHVAWCIKTNNLDAFLFKPTNGVLQPEKDVKVTVNFNGIPEQQKIPDNDRIEVRYVVVEGGTQYSHALFEASNTIRVTKSLAIGYNN